MFTRLCARLAALFGLMLIPACGAAAQVPPDRTACYVAPVLRAEARRDAECPAGSVKFAECAAHDAIVSELRAALKGCK